MGEGAGGGQGSVPRRRRPIMMRLLLAFLVVSFLPVGILSYLSLRERRAMEHRDASAAVEDVHGAEEIHGSGEVLFGVSISDIELGVAGVSVALSVAMALYIARTLVRPIKELESSMKRVEMGDLEARAPVRSRDEVGRLAGSFNRMVAAVRREAYIRDLFGQYVTPELAEAAIEAEGRLDGQLVTSSIVFSDIRDFTGVTEALPASQLIDMLNRYFDLMSSFVLENGGLVNKFGGDSLLAIFGSPLNPHPDHAARAVRTALAMRRGLEEFNRQQSQAYLPELMIGIGIATGDVVAGNVGSTSRLEYTVLGDAVNVASRLQAMTKDLNETILINAETARAAPGEAEYADVGEVEVRGRTKKTHVFAVGKEAS